MKNLSTLLVLSALMFSTAGCLKTPKVGNPFAKSESAPVAPVEIGPAPVKIEWVAAGDQDGVFLPKGFDSKSPTTSEYGEWVNRSGGQYFVPFKGIGKADYAAIFSSLPAGAQPERTAAANLANKISPANLLPARASSKAEKAEGRVDEIWKTDEADS